jgi:hypothetical protein
VKCHYEALTTAVARLTEITPLPPAVDPLLDPGPSIWRRASAQTFAALGATLVLLQSLLNDILKDLLKDHIALSLPAGIRVVVGIAALAVLVAVISTWVRNAAQAKVAD